jgi:inosine-uridine nucleoside N-ribohydrolase
MFLIDLLHNPIHIKKRPFSASCLQNSAQKNLFFSYRAGCARGLIRKIFLFIVVCLFSTQVQGKEAAPPSHPVNLIVDTDGSIDDMIAILYLLKTSRIDLKAIITTGHGLSHIEHGATNISNLLELVGYSNVPVAYGARQSLSPAGGYPAEWRNAADSVGGIKLPQNPIQPVRERGVDYMISLIMQNPLKTTLLCLGPLTNIAMALEKKPEIKDHIQQIFILGGAILTSGNLEGRLQGFRNQTAEYNIFIDAKAADQVFTSGVPITLIPLDVKEHVPITKEFFEKLAEDRKTPSANFVYEVIKPYTNLSSRTRSFFWNSLAAVLVAHPEVATYRDLKLTINLKKGPEYGRVMMTNVGQNVQVVTSIDEKEFYSIFLNALNRQGNFKQNHNESK